MKNETPLEPEIVAPAAIKELHVVIRVHNNRLLERRRRLGVSQIDLALAIGISSYRYNRLEVLRESPLTSTEEWRPVALAIADYYDVPPKELWPKQGQVEHQVNELDLVPLVSAYTTRITDDAEASHDRRDFLVALRRAWTTLAPRQQEILAARFGIRDGREQTLREIGEVIGKSKERVRQEQEDALGRLRRAIIRIRAED